MAENAEEDSVASGDAVYLHTQFPLQWGGEPDWNEFRLAATFSKRFLTIGFASGGRLARMNEPFEFMCRLWFILLGLACLVSSAAARPSYSKWLVTTADLQQKAAPPQERWECGTTPFIGTQWYEYTYRSSQIYLHSRLEVDSLEEDAHNGFVGIQFTRSLSRTPKGWLKQDLTKQLKAGDESICDYYSRKGGEMWAFTYRQNKVCGTLVFTGIPISKRAFQNLVTKWAQRARLADPSFRPRRPNLPAKR